MKKTIFITGGSGFMGKNLVEYLQDRYTLLYPSHTELDLLDDVQLSSFFNNKRIDVIIHCANRGGVRTEKNQDGVICENLRIFFNLVQKKKKSCKMIYFGSGAEYDKSKAIKKAKEIEIGKHIPQDEYGFYKYICSIYAQSARDIYSLRLFGVFGKHEDVKVRFISNILMKYIMKKPLTMIQNARFDYVDVQDVCRIVEFFITHKPKYQIYNVGRGIGRELLSIAKKINTLDSHSQEIIIQNQGMNKEYTCNNERLMAELKDFKFTPLSVSLRNLYNYYRKA